MSSYVVAVRRANQSMTLKRGDLESTPGVRVVKVGSRLMLVDATPQAARELASRLGRDVIVEPEISHQRMA